MAIRFRRRSLRSKFIIFLSGMACVVTLLVGAVNYALVRRATEATVFANEAGAAALLAPHIGMALNELRSDLRTIAGAPPIQGLQRTHNAHYFDPLDGSTAHAWRRRLETIFTSVIQENETYASIRYVGVADGGRDIVSAVRDGGVVSPLRGDELRQRADRPSFRAAMNVPEGEIYYSPVHLNADDATIPAGAPVIQVLSPVLDDHGVLFGFLSIDARFDLLIKRHIDQANPDHFIQILTDSGLVLERTRSGAHSFYAIEAAPEDRSGALRLLGDQFAPGTTAIVEVGGEAAVVSTSELRFDVWSPDRWLRFAILAPEAELFAQTNALRRITLYCAFAAFLAALAVSAIFGARFVEPLDDLVRQIKTYGQPNASRRLPLRREDEIGDLARAFKVMATAQEAARLAAQDAAERMRTLRDKAHDSLILIDEDGVILDFNVAAVALFGYRKDEAINQNIAMLMPKSEAVRHDGYIKSYVETQQGSMIGAVRIVDAMRKNGELVPVELRVTEVDFDGKRLFNGAIRDVSDRIALENELKRYMNDLEASEERFDLALRGANDGIWDWHINSGVVYYSPRWCEMLGYEAGEIEQRIEAFIAIIHPDDVERLRPLLRAIMKSDEANCELEYRMLSRDGRWLDIQSRAYRVIGDDGRVERLVGTHVDITERKAAEAELKSRTAAFELLGQIAVAANQAESVEHALQMVVDLVCEFLGWPVGSVCVVDPETRRIRPTRIWHLADPDRFERFRCHSEAHHTRSSTGLTGWVLTRREPHWAQDFAVNPKFARGPAAAEAGLTSAMAFPVIADGEVAAILEFFSESDTAPEPHVIDVLDQVGPHLGRVFEREAANRSIIAAKDEAERANQSKSTFLANMGHELRTPLNAILGYSEIIATAPESEVRQVHREEAEDIMSSGRHLLDLINDLLDISKVESGAFEIHREDTWLSAELQRAIRLVRPVMRAGGIGLELEEIGIDSATIIDADPRSLRQITLNLLTNAVKFSPHGSAVVLRAEARGDDFKLSVVDRGPGISADKIERAFERFVQVHDNSAFGGTGIGLPLSRALAEMHGGRLWLESEVGVGTTAILELPACLTQSGATAAEAGGGESELPQLQFEAPPRVLVVDDHPVNQSLLRAVLTRFGCTVEIAADGAGALAATRAHDFDLIIMDIRMPGMDGYEATRRIRAAEGGNACVPIIALTADARAEYRAEALAAGMNDHLVKPASHAEIAHMLLRWAPPSAEASAELAADAPEPEAPTAAAAPPPRELIDVTLANELRSAVGDAIIDSTLNALAEDFDTQIVGIRTAIAAGDSRELAECAHRLKGSFAAMAGREASKLAESLQALAESEPVGDGEGAAASLAEELSAIGADTLKSLRAFYAA